MFQSRQRPAVRARITKRYPQPTSDSDDSDDEEDLFAPSPPGDHNIPGFDRIVSNNESDSDSDDDEDPDTAPAPVTRLGLASVVVEVPAAPTVGTPFSVGLSLTPTATPSATADHPTTTSSPTSSLSSLTSSSLSSSSSSSVSLSSAVSSSAPVSNTPTPSSTTTAVHAAPSATQSSSNENNLPDNQGALSKGHQSGLSGGAVAGIVIVILLALLGVAAFFFRKRLMRSRNIRRTFWKAGVPASPDDFSAIEKGVGGVIEPASHGGITPFTLNAPVLNVAPVSYAASESHTASERSLDPFSDQHSIASKTSSAVTRKPPPALDARSLAVPPSLVLPKSPARTSPSTPRSSTSPVLFSQGSASLVRVTFIPSMPDELSIEPGETVRIASVFDDGWALCSNAKGQQGMVPLECLEGGGGHFSGLPAAGDAAENARSKRGSSLYTRRASSSSSLMK